MLKKVLKMLFPNFQQNFKQNLSLNLQSFETFFNKSTTSIKDKSFKFFKRGESYEVNS